MKPGLTMTWGMRLAKRFRGPDSRAQSTRRLSEEEGSHFPPGKQIALQAAATY